MTGLSLFYRLRTVTVLKRILCGIIKGYSQKIMKYYDTRIIWNMNYKKNCDTWHSKWY